MIADTQPDRANDDPTTDRSAGNPPNEMTQLDAESAEMEAYAKNCVYRPGTNGYVWYQEQSERQMELPDLLEDDGDKEAANQRYSRRVRCYIPWDLAKRWGDRHRTARSASVLLQEALRAELDRTPLPQVCEGCGGESEYGGIFSRDRRDGYSSEVFFEVYTCTTCHKSQTEAIQFSSSREVFQPTELEKYELWRHDDGIIWVGEEEAEPTEYGQALQGFLHWTEYQREKETNGDLLDPGLTKYIDAYTGKARWDAWMAKAVAAEIDLIRGTNDLASDDLTLLPHSDTEGESEIQSGEEPEGRGSGQIG